MLVTVRTSMRVPLLMVVASAVSCSQQQAPEESAAPARPAEAAPPSPLPPAMTEEEVAEVVSSAKAAKQALEEGGARLERLRKKKGVTLAQLSELWSENETRSRAVFDGAGAKRLLQERADHPGAALVRETQNRLAISAIVGRFWVEFAQWEAWADAADTSSATFYIEDDSYAENLISTAQLVVAQLDSLTPEVVSEENKDRIAGHREKMAERILLLQKVRGGIAPKVELEKFLRSGGVEVTARQLYTAFNENEVAALQKYGNGKVRVTGKVVRIEADFLDRPAVHLGTPNMFQTVIVSGVSVNEAAELKKGQKKSFYCVKVSEVTGSPVCYVAEE